jgi:hypothetical protein
VLRFLHPGVTYFTSCVHLCTVAPQKQLYVGTVTARSEAFIGDENAGCAPAQLKQGGSAMQNGRRFEQSSTSLKDRLAAFAKDVREGFTFKTWHRER